MKNLVFQVSIPKYDKEEYITKGFVKRKNFTYSQSLYDFSNQRAEEYAKRVGADYICLREFWDKLGPYYAPCYHKLYVYELFEKYDKIFYLDSDAVITKHCPDIFGYDSFSSVRDWPYTAKGDRKQKRKLVVHEIEEDHEYFCSCVLLLDKKFYDNTKEHWQNELNKWKMIRRQGVQHDQAIFNILTAKYYGKYNVLDGHWGAWWKSNPKYVIHYANVSPKLNWTKEKFLEQENRGRVPKSHLTN